ncbi:MAG: hypothetical protein K8J31_29625, partial [Anaerolineae bacterium]|nr:hypothetical protein [Anaerolineae bacterium]
MPVTRAFMLILLSLLLAAPAAAQDSQTPTRDPWALARRLLDFEADFAIPEPSPLYRPGATGQFWVGKTGAPTPTRITATLAAVDLNPYQGLYLWVEDGLTYDPDAMSELALQVNRILVTLRQRSVYGQPTLIPDVGQISDPTSLLRLPDVDNDPHLFVLYTSGLGNVQYVINSNDQLPVPVAPGGYSNQHEMILVNTSVLPGAPLDNPSYVTILAQAFYEFIMQANAADQDQWLKEALGTFLSRQLDLPGIRPNAAANYVQNPNTALTAPVSLTGNGANEGSQQIFLDYAAQRFGAPLLQNVFLKPGRGLTPFNAALEQIDAIDPITGRLVTGDALFADYVAANVATYLADRLFGDGRYLHRTSLLPNDTPPTATILNN